jgi:hypothetical protein
VARYLIDEILELYRQLRTHTFSVIVGTEYDPSTSEPRNVELLTPSYRHKDA